ncbi:MAG TPA: DUF4349 domain-containing protein [Gaiellaceae bacterium]|nr:DUF4349 domain-containing protein [Gaiellaceae bacterium]
MSQRDLVAELRAARPVAPAAVRERVRLVAASAPPASPRRLTWRRAALVALPVAAGLAAAAVLTRPGHHPAVRSAGPAPTLGRRAASPPLAAGRAPSLRPYGKAWANAGAGSARAVITVPIPQGRATRVGAYLALRVASAAAVSDDVKRAVRVATSLGGYASSVHASTAVRTGVADLTLKVPRGSVAEATTRLAALGTITAENVDVQDVQAGINETDARIAKLQAQLHELRAQQQTPTVQQKITALTAQVQRLQRSEHQTLQSVALATIAVHLQTKNAAVAVHRHHGHGPLHGLGVAFRWIGIGAIYALALGTPLAAVIALLWLGARAVRRRREEALLSTP